MPLILISNDDGIDAEYIGRLATQLEKRSIEVVVVAPEKPRSATSHSITLHKPLRVIERGPGRFSVSGSPVDCVYLALNKLLNRKPDLVVSGINDGYNVGTDVYYSGTVGAAFEGALRGAAAVSLSAQPGYREVDAKVDVAVEVVTSALESSMEPGCIVNVNIPDEVVGYRWTRLGIRYYGDDVQERRDPRGRTYYWIGGGEPQMGPGGDTDCQAVEAGLVSLTPLATERSDLAGLESRAAVWPVANMTEERES